MRLALAICSARDWKPHFGVSLAGLIAHVVARGIRGKALEQFDLIIRADCSNLCNGRHSVLDEAIGRGFSHALLMDDDISFPADAIDHLAAHGKQFVTINLATKGPDTRPTAVAFDGSFLRGPGLQETAAAGLGLCLLKLAALDGLSKPWFQFPWSDEAQTTIGEDFFFCDRLRKAGVRMFVDGTLSQACSHVGNFEYRTP